MVVSELAEYTSHIENSAFSVLSCSHNYLLGLNFNEIIDRSGVSPQSLHNLSISYIYALKVAKSRGCEKYLRMILGENNLGICTILGRLDF